MYFNIGHNFDTFSKNNYIWILDASGEIDAVSEDQGNTHGVQWGHDTIAGQYKGRYEKKTGKLSVVVPSDINSKIIPQWLLDKLESKFGYITDVTVFG